MADHFHKAMSEHKQVLMLHPLQWRLGGGCSLGDTGDCSGLQLVLMWDDRDKPETLTLISYRNAPSEACLCSDAGGGAAWASLLVQKGSVGQLCTAQRFVTKEESPFEILSQICAGSKLSYQ